LLNIFLKDALKKTLRSNDVIRTIVLHFFLLLFYACIKLIEEL
jgi:hypothetical protein